MVDELAGLALLIKVISSQLVFDVLRHLFRVNGIHDVVSFFLGEFADKDQEGYVKSDHHRTAEQEMMKP